MLEMISRFNGRVEWKNRIENERVCLIKYVGLPTLIEMKRK